MDNRPIGILDSGLGGLTAVKDVISALPFEDIIYFGDTGRVPYGTRSPRIIEKYTRQDIAFLLTQNIKALIVACGTISSSVLPAIKGDYPIPITGVLEPACRAAACTTRTGRIGVIGTSATISSASYTAILKELLPSCDVVSKACPLFVPLVESGRFDKNDGLVKTIVADYLAPMKESGIDTLVLGCTHYPILREAISNFMGSSVTLIDVGREAAEYAGMLLRESECLSGDVREGRARYFVSDAPEDFARWGGIILDQNIDGLVTRIEIEDY